MTDTTTEYSIKASSTGRKNTSEQLIKKLEKRRIRFLGSVLTSKVASAKAKERLQIAMPNRDEGVYFKYTLQTKDAVVPAASPRISFVRGEAPVSYGRIGGPAGDRRLVRRSVAQVVGTKGARHRYREPDVEPSEVNFRFPERVYLGNYKPEYVSKKEEEERRVPGFVTKFLARYGLPRSAKSFVMEKAKLAKRDPNKVVGLWRASRRRETEELTIPTPSSPPIPGKPLFPKPAPKRSVRKEPTLTIESQGVFDDLSTGSFIRPDDVFHILSIYNATTVMGYLGGVLGLLNGPFFASLMRMAKKDPKEVLSWFVQSMKSHDMLVQPGLLSSAFTIASGMILVNELKKLFDDEIVSQAGTFFKGKVVSTSLKALGTVVALLAVPERYRKEFKGYTLAIIHSFLTDGVSAMDALATCMGAWSGFVERLFSGEPFWDALEDGNQRWLARAETLILTAGEFRSKPKPTDVAQFLCEMQLLINESSTMDRNIIGDAFKRLEGLRRHFLSSRDGRRRQPLGLIITGAAGVGKTKLCDYLAHMTCSKYGLDPKIVWPLHSVSRSGFEVVPAYVGVLVGNDILDTKDESMSSPTLDMLQAWVDTAPLDLHSDSIENKEAARSLAPDYVVLPTNATHFRFTQSTGNASKLIRRYHGVQVYHEDDPDGKKGLKYELHKMRYKVYQLRSIDKITLSFLPREDDETVVIFDKLENFLRWAASECESLGQKSEEFHMCGTSMGSVSCPLPPGHEGPCFVTFNGKILPQGRVTDFFRRCCRARVDHVVSIDERVQSYLDELPKKAVLKLGSFALAALGVAIGLKTIQAFMVQQTKSQGELVTNVPSIPPEPGRRVVPSSVVTQPWVSPIASRHFSVFKVMGSDLGGSDGTAVALTNSVIIFPAHYLLEATLWTKPTFRVTCGSRTEAINVGSVKRVEGRDLMICPINTLINGSFTLLGKLRKQTYLPATGTFDGTEVNITSRTSTFGSSWKCQKRDLLFYDKSTAKGDCGKLLWGKDNKVVGMHVGGETSAFTKVTKNGVGEPLSQALLRPYLDALMAMSWFDDADVHVDPPDVKHLEPDLHPQSDAAWLRESNYDHEDHGFLPLGHDLHYLKFTCTAKPTKMFPSVGTKIQAFGPPHSGKARRVVSPSGDVAWLSPDVHRFNNAPAEGYLNHYLMMEVISEYLKEMPPIDTPRTPVGLKVAIEGSFENAFYNPRDNDKGVGPTLQAAKVTKKNCFWKNPSGEWEVHPLLVELYRRDEKLLLDPEASLPVSLVQAQLKDEVYPEVKRMQGKGRYFYVCDLHTNLLGRSYGLPVGEFLMSHPEETGVNVNMNCSSFQWNSFAEFISKNGEHPTVFDGDFSAYDNCHNFMLRYASMVFYRLALHIGYSQEDAKALFRQSLSMNRYILIMQGNYYYTSTGLTSGRWDTILVNCVVQALMWRYALKIVKIPREHVRFSFTGDDSLVSTNNPSFEANMTAISTLFTDMGYKLTDPQDKSAQPKARALSEVTYLKRRFVYRQGFGYMAPLEQESIYKSLAYFVKGSVDEDERNRGALQFAVREAFLHNEEFFREIVSLAKEYYPDLALPTWRELEIAYEQGIFNTWELDPDYLPGFVGGVATKAETGSDSAEGVSAAEVVEKSPFEGEQTISGESQIVPQSTWSGLWNDNKIGTAEINPTFTAHNDAREQRSEPIVNIGAFSRNIDTSTPGVRSMRAKQPEMDINMFLQRPRVIAEWDTNTDFQSVIGITAWYALPEVASFLENYTLFRGDLRLTMTVTGSSQFIGKFRLGAYPADTTVRDPYTYPDTAPWNISASFPGSIARTSALPHVDVDLSCTETYSLDLPFPLGREYLALGTSDVDWNIFLQRVNVAKFANGNTPPVLTIRLFAHYENIELNRIVPQGEDGDDEKEMPQHLLSKGLSYASELASVAAGAGVPFASPFSKVADFSAKVARHMGYSRLPTEAQTSIVARQHGNPALTSSQPDHSFTLGTDLHVMRNADHRVIPLAVPGETRFRSIVSRWGQVAKDLQADEIIIADPCTCPKDTVSTLGWFHLTPLGHATLMFQYWTGSLEYCFEVMSSPLVRWRIGIVIIPPGVTKPVNFPTGGGFITHIVEVAGTTCYNFEVPYLFTEPWSGPTVFSAVNTNPFSAFTRIAFYPLTTATGPSPTEVLPEVNVYVRAGSSYSVGVPSLQQANEYRIVSQGEITPSGDESASVNILDVGEQSVITFGEPIDDLLSLTRRSVIWWRGENLNEFSTGFISVPIRPFLPTDSGITTSDGKFMGWTFDSWLSTAFLGETGSYQTKIVLRDNASPVEVGSSYLHPMDGEPSFGFVSSKGWTGSSLGAVYLDNRQTPLMEVRVPDRNTYQFRRTRAYDAGTVNDVWCIYAQDNDAVDHVYDFWSGGADDYLCGGYLCPPAITARTGIA